MGVSALSPDPVGVFGNDGLTLSVSLSGLRVAQVEGRFDAQEVLLEDTVFLDSFGELQALDVGWSSLDVGLRLHNTSSLDFSCSVESVSRLDSGAAGWVEPALWLISLNDVHGEGVRAIVHHSRRRPKAHACVREVGHERLGLAAAPERRCR